MFDFSLQRKSLQCETQSIPCRPTSMVIYNHEKMQNFNQNGACANRLLTQGPGAQLEILIHGYHYIICGLFQAMFFWFQLVSLHKQDLKILRVPDIGPQNFVGARHPWHPFYLGPYVVSREGNCSLEVRGALCSKFKGLQGQGRSSFKNARTFKVEGSLKPSREITS